MENRKKINLVLAFAVCAIVVFTLPAMTQALHEPPGIRANSGSVYHGSFAAWIESYTSAYVHRTVHDYSGDLYVKGHSIGGVQKLVYYCIIKISPADSSHKYMKIRASCDFEYGMSAGWFSAAEFDVWYCTLDLGSSTLRQIGWSEEHYKTTVGGWWGGVSDNQHWYSPLSWLRMLDTSPHNIHYNDRPYHRLTFSSSSWYYVGIQLTITLSGFADIYKDYSAIGDAHFNPVRIYWQFTET